MNRQCLPSKSPFRCRAGQLLMHKQFYFHLKLQKSPNVKMCEKRDGFAVRAIPWVYKGKGDLQTASTMTELFFSHLESQPQFVLI